MPSVRALSRGLTVLDCLARSASPMTPGMIAELADLDRATSSRLLQTLVDDGYVRKVAKGRYALTTKLLELASAGGIASGLRDIARPVMRELRDRYEETIHLGIVEGDRVVYIEKLEPSHQRVALVTSVGQSMPIHSTALGKAILGEMSTGNREAILNRIAFEPKTAATITSKERIPPGTGRYPCARLRGRPRREPARCVMCRGPHPQRQRRRRSGSQHVFTDLPDCRPVPRIGPCSAGGGRPGQRRFSARLVVRFRHLLPLRHPPEQMSES